MYEMDARGVLSNLKGWNMWEFGTYKLRKEEADVIIATIEQKTQLLVTNSDDASICEGDIVTVSHGNIKEEMVVTHVNLKDRRITCMSSKGLFFPFLIEQVQKTGKGYPQLLQIMESLKKGEMKG